MSIGQPIRNRNEKLTILAILFIRGVLGFDLALCDWFLPDFDSFTRISYTTDFSAFCSVGLAGFVGGELSLSEEIN